ncbi:MAG TPA: hypothetical protein VMG63_26970, partial [Terriglobia bacterium]|nr:hypothetical protein [Terriglobia bacterium]
MADFLAFLPTLFFGPTFLATFFAARRTFFISGFGASAGASGGVPISGFGASAGASGGCPSQALALLLVLPVGCPS